MNPVFSPEQEQALQGIIRRTMEAVAGQRELDAPSTSRRHEALLQQQQESLRLPPVSTVSSSPTVFQGLPHKKNTKKTKKKQKKAGFIHEAARVYSGMSSARLLS